MKLLMTGATRRATEQSELDRRGREFTIALTGTCLEQCHGSEG